MRLKITGLLLVMFWAAVVCAAPAAPAEPTVTVPAIAPPSDIKAADTPNDAGHAITVSWQASPDEVKKMIEGYEVLRSETPEGEFIKVGYVPYGFTSFDDQDVPDNGKDYFYQVKAVGRESQAYSLVSVSARSAEQWFNTMRINALIGCILFTLIVVIFIGRAKSGQSLFIRRIAGLAAVEEAVGRATEMGRPILYVPGLSSISDVATIAALNILGQVAKKTAEYDTPLLVPWAESLILAETGAETGAIQIAGTDAIHQLPFFITACDYTLIGEELYAASAYLSKEPMLLGTLKGQDWSKAVIVLLLIIGLAVSLVAPGIREIILQMLKVG